MSTAIPSRPPVPRPGIRPASAPSREGGRSATLDPFKVLRKHALLIIASIFVGGGLGVGAFILLARYAPVYQAFVVFEVQQGVADAADLAIGRGMREEEVLRVARTELAIIQQRELLMEAMSNPAVQRTSWFQNSFIHEGQPLVADAVDELERDLQATALRGTYLFEIRWGARNRADAPVILNAIATAYITRRRQDDDRVFSQNIAAFQRQAGETGNNIADLQRTINEMILEAGITSLDDPRYSEAARALDGIIVQLQGDLVRRNMFETQLQQVRAKLAGTLGYDDDDIQIAETTDTALRMHISTINDLRVEIRSLREQYADDQHRLVRQAEARLRAAEAERDAQREEVIRRNLNARAKALVDSIEQLGSLIAQLDKEMEERSFQLRELATKQSEYQTLQSRLMFLERSRESLIQLERDVQLLRVREDARRTRIVATASEPRNVHFPRREIIVPLGVLLVSGLTVGLIFLFEITDRRVKTASDLMVVPGVQLLGIAPEVEEDPTRIRSADLVVHTAPHSVLAESWRQVGTQMLRSIDQSGHQSVVFVGGLPGSGATTAVSNLACAFVASGRRVVVVEGNFRRPRMASLVGLSPTAAGLGDILHDSVTLDEALQTTQQGFSVITAGTPKSRIVERLATPRMNAVVAELRSQFDLVLFDVPPAVIAGDAMAVAHAVDAAVLIVRANQEERGLVARVVGQLQRAGCDLLGVVLNRPRRTAGGYFKRNFAAMAAYRPKSEEKE